MEELAELLARVRELTRDQRHEEALAAARALLVTTPENADVLYLLAANQRCLGEIPQALATLARLEQHHPAFSLLYQERGYCALAQRNGSNAIAAFAQAVTLNPGLSASWRMLEQLYRLSGDSQNIELLRLRGRVSHQHGALDAAEAALARVLQIAPDDRVARADYVRVLIDGQKYSLARIEIGPLLELEPDNGDYGSLYATALAGLGEHELAITSYRAVLAGDNADMQRRAQLTLLLAHSLKAAGRLQEAVDCYRAAAAVRPGFGDAYWSLANLKTYRFSQDALAHMAAEEASTAAGETDRRHLCFALGKSLEDLREYGQSWHYYERGNALQRARSQYRPEFMETNTARQIQVCTAGFFAARSAVGAPQPDPIFIVGLPRSGSTLIEQILASHSRVEGTQELPDIPRIVRELMGSEPSFDNPRYPGILNELAPEEFRKLGERYLQETLVYRNRRPFFLDKMPNNFRHVGLIHLMLPNATIIDVRREPMACCFSNLKQLFAAGQEFTYSIEDIARYYRTYLDLMRHWENVLPGRVLRVSYEDVVQDLESNVRRILQFCGLQFEPACLEFYKTERSIRTASSEQVRQPIYREGLSQWRNYEPWLEPLRVALGDALSRYRE